MLTRTLITAVYLHIIPLLAIAQEIRSFDTEAFSHMEREQKVEVLKKTDFSLPTSRSNAVEYFTARWNDEPLPIVATFCQAMGSAKAQEAIPVLVLHIDFRYIEDMDAERPRTILEGRVALEALVQIGFPAVPPAAQHIVARLSKSQDQHDIYFLCEALDHLVRESMEPTEARQYVRRLIDEQKDEHVRHHLQTVAGKL